MADILWTHFKSGTDIRGVAVDGVAGEPLNLTDEVIARMAGGFLCWLSEKSGKAPAALTIAVGRDSRISGPRIRDAVVRALTAGGATVADCGLASTPSMFMATVKPVLGGQCADGAIQITASHHPFHRNGLKFFRPTGGLEGADITAILQLAEKGYAPTAPVPGTCTAVDFMADYAALLRQIIVDGVDAGEQPLAGFHIVVDAGNGVGGFYADHVLAPLGADVSGSQFLEPDGHFPNHIPNPEDATAMASVCAATRAAGADLGVIFDTDVDRAGLVDADGREINRNRLIALAAAVTLADHPGGTVVTDSVTSDGLKTFIQDTLGGVHCRFKRGYKNVIGEAMRLCDAGVDAPLAIETSGHAALRENYFLDDGAYLATRLIIQAAKLKREGRTLADLIATLPEPAETAELRFAITAADFRTAGQAVLDALEALAHQKGWQVADDSREGVRISFGEADGDGWLLLRLSVHDPVLPLNIESNRIGGTHVIARQIADLMHAQTTIDCGKFDAFLKE